MRFVCIIIIMLAWNVSARAEFVTIASSTLTINATNTNRTDLGGPGPHTGGLPTQPGVVTWKLDSIGAVALIRAEVDVRLFMDTFDIGHMLLTIEYRDLNGNVLPNGRYTFDSQLRGYALSGANDPNHQMTIEHGFASANLRSVRFITQYRNVNFSSTNERSVSLPLIRRLVRQDGPGSDFGANGYNCLPTGCVGPIGSGRVDFSHRNGEVNAAVQGTMYWPNANQVVMRLQIEYRDINGTVLRTQVFSRIAPGGSNPNLPGNQLSVNTNEARFESGALRSVRITFGIVVQATGAFVQHGVITAHILPGNPPGTFEVSPTEAVVSAGNRVNFIFTWSVPESQNWHDLDVIQFRIRDGDDTLISILFDEPSQTLALVNEQTGQIGNSYEVGTNKRLETSGASLFLKDCVVEGSGPTGPSVTLLLSVGFKHLTAAGLYSVEVNATGDTGDSEKFVTAGTVRVY